MPTVTDTTGEGALWYWPSPNAGAAGSAKIGLGDPLSDLEFELVHLGTSGRAASGRTRRLHLGAYYEARLVFELFTSRTLYQSLQTLESHLKRGGFVAISASTVKAYASFTSQTLGPGNSIIQVNGRSPFPSGVQTDGIPDVTFASGDEVVLQSAWPDSTVEQATVSSHSGNTITLSSGLVFDHVPPVMIRHVHFFPVMVLAPEAFGAPIVVARNGRVFTIDLLLQEDPAGWMAASGLGGAPLQQPSSPLGSRLDDLIAQHRGGGLAPSRVRNPRR